MYHLFVTVFLLALALHMGTNSVEASPEDGAVLFNPSDYMVNYKMPASCEDKRFCFDKGDKYPDKKIADMLKDMRSLPVEAHPRLGSNLSFRGGNEPDDNPDCPSNRTYIDKPIYYIVDEFDKVRVVIQSPKLEQIYSVKWCQYPGRILTRETPNFLQGSNTLIHYNVECVNTIMDFDFFVLSEYGLKIEVARAQGGIPVCCRCRYSHLK